MVKVYGQSMNFVNGVTKRTQRIWQNERRTFSNAEDLSLDRHTFIVFTVSSSITIKYPYCPFNRIIHEE